MNVEQIREYCLTKKSVSEGFPFDKQTLVFKVKGKMFLLMNLEGDLRINVKYEPEKALELREHYSAVQPGYHMHKKHWNTVKIDGSVSDETIMGWIDDSYSLIVKSLPKKDQDETSSS